MTGLESFKVLVSVSCQEAYLLSLSTFSAFVLKAFCGETNTKTTNRQSACDHWLFSYLVI